MEVSEDERESFELSASDKWVYVHEDENGFVELEYYTSQTLAEEAEYFDSELS